MTPKRLSRTLPIANLLAFIAVLTVNYLSNALPLNGQTAEQISDALPSFFTPAGYTFAIWGVIYAALLGFIIYQLLPGSRSRPFLARVGWLFVASSLANIAWLFAWHYGIYWLSVILMVSLLLILAAIYRRLDIGQPATGQNQAERWLVHLPFSLYLGWITVATVANVASVLGYLGWGGFGLAGPVWSVTMMLVAALVAALLLYNRRDLAYAAVLVWAFFGIRAAYPDEALITSGALVAAALVIMVAVVGWWRTRRPDLTDSLAARTG